MMMQLRYILAPLALVFAAAIPAAYAGQPLTSHGVDVIVGDATGAAGDTIAAEVRFVPGPDDLAPGGPDEVSSVQFTVDYTGLDLDPTDANQDQTPDAVVFNPDQDPTLASAFQLFVTAEATHLDIIVADLTRSVTLPAVTLLTIHFHIPATAAPEVLPLTLSNVQAFDNVGDSQPIDEAVDGSVTITQEAASPTPTPSPSATPTSPPSPTSTRTLRPTATPPGPTVGPNTPPPGYEVNVHSEDGGCAIAGRSSPACSPVVFGAVLLWWRRRRGAATRLS